MTTETNTLNIFKTNTEMVQAAQKQASMENAPKMEMFKPASRAQPHRVRVIPPLEGHKSQYPYVIGRSHYVQIPGIDAFWGVCGKSLDSRGESSPCAFCELHEDLANRPGEAAQKIADGAKSRLACFTYVLVRGEEEKGIQLWRTPWTIIKELRSYMSNPDLGLADFTDPMNGRDLLITKTGSGFNTSYQVTPHMKNSAIADSVEAISLLVKDLPDLMDRVTPESYDDTKAKVTKALGGKKDKLDAATQLNSAPKKEEEVKAIEATVVDADDDDQALPF